jgi:hypothetical protein
VSTPKANATLVDALGSCLRRGDHALGTVPELLKRVLREEAWREFETQRGELVCYERFADFVKTPPLKGLGATVDLVRRVVGDDPEAVDLLDRALQQRHGGPRSKTDIISLATRDRAGGSGTSREYALRRLRKDAPDLHAEVISGKLSAHAAMVKAGLTPSTFTVRVTSPQAVVEALRRRLPAEWLQEVAHQLTPESSG